jgi:hypothetical protein
MFFRLNNSAVCTGEGAQAVRLLAAPARHERRDGGEGGRAGDGGRGHTSGGRGGRNCIQR